MALKVIAVFGRVAVGCAQEYALIGDQQRTSRVKELDPSHILVELIPTGCGQEGAIRGPDVVLLKACQTPGLGCDSPA